MAIEIEALENELIKIAPVIGDLIKSHMEDQPYKITCSNCGKELDVECSVDGDFDLKIEVNPHECGEE